MAFLAVIQEDEAADDSVGPVVVVGVVVLGAADATASGLAFDSSAWDKGGGLCRPAAEPKSGVPPEEERNASIALPVAEEAKGEAERDQGSEVKSPKPVADFIRSPSTTEVEERGPSISSSLGGAFKSTSSPEGGPEANSSSKTFAGVITSSYSASYRCEEERK